MKKQLLLVVVTLALTYACKKSEPGLPGKWQQKANLPLTPGRTGAVSFAIGGKGYFVGGSENPVYHNDVYAYDPATDSWTQKTSCPGNHFLFPACFVIHDIAYIGICQIETGYTKEFWAYNPATDGWSRKADYPGSAQSGSPNFAIGDFGYVASDSSTDFWMYDPLADKWTRKNDVPIGVSNKWGANFVIGNKGYTGAGGDIKFWEYDPVQDSWSSKAPKVGFGLAGCSLNGRGYFLGLDQGNSGMYNPQSNSWSPVAFYGNRGSGTAFTLDSKIYFASGGNGKDGLLNDFWEFTPE
jgi:N-acetylneuraminic acid mutarotase